MIKVWGEMGDVYRATFDAENMNIALVRLGKLDEFVVDGILLDTFEGNYAVDELFEDSRDSTVLKVLKSWIGTLVFDFKDGSGLVPARRHINPDGSEGGWVAETAVADDTVIVGYNARVFQKACVAEFAQVLDEAQIYGDSLIMEEGVVFGKARVYGDAVVRGDAKIGGTTVLCVGTIQTGAHGFLES